MTSGAKKAVATPCLAASASMRLASSMGRVSLRSSWLFMLA